MKNIITYLLLMPFVLFAQYTQIPVDNQVIVTRGDTLVTVTGLGVSQWNNLAQNLHATQGTDGARPEWIDDSYVYFDRSNQESILFGDNNAFTPGNGTRDFPWSIAMYVNMTDATAAPLFACWNASGFTEYFFGSFSGSDLLSIGMYSGTTIDYIRAQADDALTAYEGTWITVAASYDGSGSNTGFLIYINGQPVDITLSSNGTYTTVTNTTANLILGRGQAQSIFYDGNIDWTIRTDDVLTPTEMADIHTLFSTGSWPSENSTLTAAEYYWSRGARIDNEEENRIVSWTDINSDLALTDTIAVTLDGDSVEFNTATSRLGLTTGLLNPNTTDFTVAGRFKFTTPAATRGNIIAKKLDQTTAGAGWAIYTHSSNIVIATISDGTNDVNVQSPTLTPGQVYNFAMVRDSDSLRLYIDGEQSVSAGDASGVTGNVTYTILQAGLFPSGIRPLGSSILSLLYDGRVWTAEENSNLHTYFSTGTWPASTSGVARKNQLLSKNKLNTKP